MYKVSNHPDQNRAPLLFIILQAISSVSDPGGIDPHPDQTIKKHPHPNLDKHPDPQPKI